MSKFEHDRNTLFVILPNTSSYFLYFRIKKWLFLTLIRNEGVVRTYFPANWVWAGWLAYIIHATGARQRVFFDPRGADGLILSLWLYLFYIQIGCPDTLSFACMHEIERENKASLAGACLLGDFRISPVSFIEIESLCIRLVLLFFYWSWWVHWILNKLEWEELRGKIYSSPTKNVIGLELKIQNLKLSLK